MHGLAGRLRDLRRFHHEVGLIATAKATAHQGGVHVHFFRGKSGHLGDYRLRPLRSLRGNPGLRAIGTDVHSAIHRLHAGVGGEGQLVDDFDFLCGGAESGIGVAIIAYDFSWLGGILDEVLAQRLAGFAGVGAFVPSDFERLAALNGGPGIICEDDDAAGGEGAFTDSVDGDYVADTGNSLGLAGVKLCDFAAENRAAGDDGVLHGRHARVDAEFCRAGGFGGGLEALAIVADDGEVVGIL